MKKVQFNVSFKDRYTGKMNVAGNCANMTEERVKEIKEVNPNFITVIGNVEEPDKNSKDDKNPEGDKTK